MVALNIGVLIMNKVSLMKAGSLQDVVSVLDTRLVKAGGPYKDTGEEDAEGNMIFSGVKKGTNMDFVGDGFETPTSLGVPDGHHIAFVEDENTAEHTWAHGATQKQAIEDLHKELAH